jgi:cytochrome c oxidase assembly protein Cox11
MASPNLDEIVTTTLRSRSKELADNYTSNTALLFRFGERGNKKVVTGGSVILEELFYAENSTYTRYSGYETLNIAPSDVMTAAEFNLKQAAVACRGRAWRF